LTYVSILEGLNTITASTTREKLGTENIFLMLEETQWLVFRGSLLQYPEMILGQIVEDINKLSCFFQCDRWFCISSQFV
jgi:hypothetical protein